MDRAIDIVERLLHDLECAGTVWLVKANPDTIDMIAVGGRYTHLSRRSFPRKGTLTNAVLAKGEDVVIVPDVWSLNLPAASRMALLASRAESNLIAIVRVDGQPWGVLSATSSRTECPFTDKHVALIRQAALDISARLAQALIAAESP